MIGKRRFIVVLSALALAGALEVVGLALAAGGISTNGQIAISTLVGLYMGSKYFEKPEMGGK